VEWSWRRFERREILCGIRAERNANGDADGNIRGDCNSDGSGYSYSYSYSYSNSDRYGHGYGEPDSNCFGNAAACRDAKAPSDASTAPDSITVTGTINAGTREFRVARRPALELASAAVQLCIATKSVSLGERINTDRVSGTGIGDSTKRRVAMRWQAKALCVWTCSNEVLVRFRARKLTGAAKNGISHRRAERRSSH
jgi:hypothetical protein